MTNHPDGDMLRIAVVEDHLLQRRQTEELINAQPEFTVANSSETMPEFIGWLKTAERREWPHLLILDLMVDRQPSVDPAVVRGLIDAGLLIMVLSALASPPLVRGIIRAGVNTIASKHDSEQNILAAIRAVVHGREWMSSEVAGVIAGDLTRPRLSIQEERALALYASGLTLAAVAALMGVKGDTAKQYLNRVRKKYRDAGQEAHSKLDLSRIAVDDGYLDPARD